MSELELWNLWIFFCCCCSSHSLNLQSKHIFPSYDYFHENKWENEWESTVPCNNFFRLISFSLHFLKWMRLDKIHHFNHSKVYNSVGFSTFAMLCAVTLSNSRLSSSPWENLYPLSTHSPFSTPWVLGNHRPASCLCGFASSRHLIYKNIYYMVFWA